MNPLIKEFEDSFEGVAFYNKDGAVHHTLKYVNWLEERVKGEPAQLCRIVQLMQLLKVTKDEDLLYPKACKKLQIAGYADNTNGLNFILREGLDVLIKLG